VKTNKAEILKELPFEGVRAIHGVTYDGSSVWFAADEGDLFQVNPETGAIVSRTPDLGCRAGMTFDGRNLWVICGKEIRQLDPKTRSVLSRIPTPNAHVSGMAWHQGALFLGAYEEKKILKVDPATGRVLKTIPVNRFVTGVTFADGELWYGTLAEGDQPGGLYQVDERGQEISSIPLRENEGISGIEYDTQRGAFWCGQHDLSRSNSSTNRRLRMVRKPAS